MDQTKSHTGSNFMAINLACGGKLCHLPGWINADHRPSNKNVMQVNLLKALPFHDNTFDIVYHSQFIEHLPMDQANVFLKECYRVLKPNGIIRIVTPDLKDQASEYLRNLQEILRVPNDEEAKLRYEWIRLEMLDQLIRHKTGGDMVSFLFQSGFRIRNYLSERLGLSGDRMLPSSEPISTCGQIKQIKKYLRHFLETLKNNINKLIPESYIVGNFRLSGEAHLCMYDQYLLSTVLAECQFSDIALVNAKVSRIPDWDFTFLDSDRHGNPDCPSSLFMEASKMVQSKVQ